MVLQGYQPLTLGDFERVLSEQDASHERLLELVHGEVVEKLPTELHGKLAALIAHFLLAFVLPRGIAAHVGVEVRHQTSEDRYNSRLPDVSLRLSDAPASTQGAVMMFPDLAVEIQSPSDRPHQMRQKALYYLQKGTRLVWLFYPEARTVDVCTLDEDGNLALSTLAEGESLTGGAVLPDFALDLAQVFTQL